jgi:hypothetical protein
LCAEQVLTAKRQGLDPVGIFDAFLIPVSILALLVIHLI